MFTLIDTTCLQQAGWNVYINEKLRKYLSSISVSFSTFTFLMTGDNYQANVVDKTDHMWRTIFILISGGWGGHHGWKLRVSFSLSLSRWPEIMDTTFFFMDRGGKADWYNVNLTFLLHRNGTKRSHGDGNDRNCDKFSGQLPICPPSSLLEASCLGELEHNCREEMITICIEKQFWTMYANVPLF